MFPESTHSCMPENKNTLRRLLEVNKKEEEVKYDDIYFALKERKKRGK